MTEKKLKLEDGFRALKDEHQKEVFMEFLINFSLEKINDLENLADVLSRERNELKQLSMINDKLTTILNSKVTKLESHKEDLKSTLDEKTNDLLKSEKFAAIGELSARLSHDLKNPLSVIRGAVELLNMTNKNVDKETIHRYELINSAIDKMTHHLDNVLDFVRTKKLNLQEKSFLSIIDSSLEKIKVPDYIKINSPQNNMMILVDPVQFEIVFVNIIINAIHAIDETDAINKDGFINIKVNENFGNILFEIENSGPEIPPEYLQTIFEPLVTTKTSGTGLGLTSCKNIVEAHGGMLSVSNNPTKFSIVLPK